MSRQKSTMVSLRIPNDELTELRAEAQTWGVSLSEYLRMCTPARSGVDGMVKLTSEGKQIAQDLRRLADKLQRQEQAVLKTRQERDELIRHARGRLSFTRVSEASRLHVSRVSQIWTREEQ